MHLDADLEQRARTFVASGQRRILGVTGAPAAGKSTMSAALVEALTPGAVLVPMDGYHLANAELDRLGRHERKGAPDTFDRDGYVALLRRLRERTDPIVWAPEFRREIEEPIAGAIAVPREIPLVITEGNYLLHWPDAHALIDEVWYVEMDELTRLERLIARHMSYGRSREQATERAYGSDQRNAELIAATRGEASLVVRL